LKKSLTNPLFKRKFIGLAILLVALPIALISAAALFRWDLLFTGRNAYLEYGVYETRAGWNSSPQAIATDLTNNWCNDPGICQIDTIRIFRVAPNKAIIVFQTRNLRGDSVGANQVRVELIQAGGTWKVVWAGMRWRCSPFRGNYPAWTVETCP
jgi:hypothetical protein